MELEAIQANCAAVNVEQTKGRMCVVSPCCSAKQQERASVHRPPAWRGIVEEGMEIAYAQGTSTEVPRDHVGCPDGVGTSQLI